MLLTAKCRSTTQGKNSVAFLWQQWLCESVSMLRSTYTAHLVCIKKKYKKYNNEGAAARTHKPPIYRSCKSHANSSGNAGF